MSIFDAFSGRKRVGGEIGYFGLQKWWSEQFSADERQYIIEKYSGIDPEACSLVEGEILGGSQSVVSFLGGLAGWFKKDTERHLAYKILERGEELISADTDVLDIHFFCQAKIEVLYRDRSQPGCLERAIAASHQQIEITPQTSARFREENPSLLPTHRGYEQLAIILEKQKDYQGAIAMCEQAADQGWGGDWEKRIIRCRGKAEKL